jgi:translocator assembly and maintenance protein 41
LEEIVATFNSPIRYAFAYGSGVFEQEGMSLDKNKKPMLDFIFAVSHPEHWHSINLTQNPSHYGLHARLLGSDFVGRVQNWGPAAVWFNPFVPVSGVVRATPGIGISYVLIDFTFRTLNMALYLSITYVPICSHGIRSTLPVECTSRCELSKMTLACDSRNKLTLPPLSGLHYSLCRRHSTSVSYSSE